VTGYVAVAVAEFGRGGKRQHPRADAFGMDERADGSAADGSTAAGTGRGRAALIEGDAEFDGRDAALLRAVHEAGSVAGAASELGRSRARALLRIEALEGAFGTLVERDGAGVRRSGSRLTGAGRDLLDRYDRLQAVLAATANVPETVLDGTVARASTANWQRWTPRHSSRAPRRRRSRRRRAGADRRRRGDDL